MSTTEQRKAWRGVGQRWHDGGYLSVVELNTLTHAVVALVDEVEEWNIAYAEDHTRLFEELRRVERIYNEQNTKLASREKALREVQALIQSHEEKCDSGCCLGEEALALLAEQGE